MAEIFAPGQSKDIFPIKIYEAEFPNFETIRDEIISAMIPHFESKNLADGNDYIFSDGEPMIIRTGNELHKDPAFKSVVDFIEYHGREYWRQSDLTSRVEPYILQLWANRVPPGGFTPAHNHNPVPVAGAFYIDANPEKGNLYLEDPLEMVQGRMPRDFLHKPYLYTETIKVTSGKLVMFPGYLRHHTRSNLSKENRYVFGFNFGYWQHFMPKPTGQ